MTHSMSALEHAKEAVDWLGWAEDTDNDESRVQHYQHAIAALSKATSAAKRELRTAIENYTPPAMPVWRRAEIFAAQPPYPGDDP